jgi:hypothetical protein
MSVDDEENQHKYKYKRQEGGQQKRVTGKGVN